METDLVAEETTLVSRSSSRPAILALTLGFIIAYGEVILRMLQGKDIVDAVWPHAVRSLDWTMALRSSMESVLFLVAFFVSSAYFIRKRLAEEDSPRLRLALYCLLGLTLGLTTIHLLMDVFYLRGAFLLLPTLFGVILISLLLSLGGMPTIREMGQRRIAWPRILHLCGVFFAAWLIVPGVPALIGFAPSPPDAPAIGYGAAPGPFDTVQFSEAYEMPEEVKAVQGGLEDDIVFSVYLTLPLIAEDKEVESIPLAILLHGFGYPDADAYQDWMTHLAAKGMAVALLQYPSDLRPDGYEDFEATDIEGESDFLQHTYRDVAIRAAIEHLNQMAIQEPRHAEVNAHLGNMSIEPSDLWVGGHSLGAGYTFITLDDILARGWANHSLVVALEAPASRPAQAGLQPNLTNLPEQTLVQIGVSQDDMSVGVCPGVFFQQMFSQLPNERNQLIEVQSDKYGFPRLIASHYLQADPAHDSLSDWSFYRRIDAQADFIVAQSRHDTFTADWAYQYMTDETMLTQMGKWSDGTPVLPLKLYHDALNTSTDFDACS